MAEALGKIDQVMTTAGSYAETALSAAESALSTLAGMDVPLWLGSAAFTPPGFSPSLPGAAPLPGPLVPGAPPGSYSPSSPTPPTPPAVNPPTPPTLLDPEQPDKPSLMPLLFQDPVLGSMVNISIPSPPVIDFRSFDITPPDPISITPGTWVFTVEDILIADDPMVVAIMNRIRDNVANGGTGLSPAIEADIWDRDLERLIQASDDAVDKLTSTWAKKGFSLPDGFLANSISDLHKEFGNKRIDRSREIAIEQAKLEQTNLFKSMEIGVTLAFKLIEQLNANLEIVFKTQEATAKYANEYIRLQIETVNSEVEIFKARVQAYEAEIKAAQGKVDVYKAQIEAEVGKITINKGTVEVYTAEVSAEVQKARGIIDTNDGLVKMYSSEVQAMAAINQVNESLVKAYAEGIRAEIAKAEMFKAQCEGIMALVGIERAKVEANIAQVTAWAKGVDAQIAAYNGSVESIRASAQIANATASISNSAAEATARIAIASAQVASSNSEIYSRSVTARGAIMVEAARGVATAAAQMAAGAMAAVSAQAKVGYEEMLDLTP